MGGTGYHTACRVGAVDAAGGLDLGTFGPHGDNNIIEVANPFISRAQFYLITEIARVLRSIAKNSLGIV